PNSTACEEWTEKRERMPPLARGSLRRNRRTAEFRSARQGLQARRSRSRVPWRVSPKPRHDTQTRVGVTLAIRARASLAFARKRTGLHFDGDHCLVVEGIYAGSMLGHGLEDFVHHAVRRLGGAAGDDRLHSLRPKRLAVPVARVKNTVAVEHEQIARLGLETEFVVI